MKKNEDFFSQVSRRAKESKIQWDQIDGHLDELYTMDLPNETHMLLEVVRLLAAQLRPIGSEQDIEDMTKDMGKMLSDAIGNMKKGGIIK